MATSRDLAHSTIEVISQQPWYQAEQWNTLPSDPGKQVAIDDGKQVTIDAGKQFIGDDSGLEAAPKEVSDQHKVDVHHVLAQRLSKRRWIILCGTVGLIIVVGAVLGGVLGSRHKSSMTASSTSPLNSSATPLNSSATPLNSSAPPLNSSPTSPPATPTKRNIAAVSFTSNSTNMTRVYFQDDEGQIIEALNSAGNMTWSISKTGIGGKPGSAIAAAVSPPSLPLKISIFYLDVSNLIHDISYTVSTGSWTSGTLSAQGYTVMANSSLSAVYNWCRLCTDTTFIAFQDENGFVQIGNFTSGHWTLKQLGQDLEPELGTGLALRPSYNSDSQDLINLYYQKSDLDMAVAVSQLNSPSDDWSLLHIYDSIPPGSPIATASSYSTVSIGNATWLGVLCLSTTGIVVSSLSGTSSHWLAYFVHPSVMANSTSNMKVFDSVAVTALGNTFAVVKQDGQPDVIENWQVAENLVDWSSIGNVNLNGAWG